MAPSKNLYVADQDLPIWEDAERVSRKTRRSVSQITAAALRQYLAPVRPDSPAQSALTDLPTPSRPTPSHPDYPNLT